VATPPERPTPRPVFALVLLGACTLLSPSASPPPAAPVVIPSDLAPASSPVPFGFWGLNTFLTPAGLADVKARTGLTVVQLATSGAGYTLGTLLPLMRESGVRITLRLTGDHEFYTTRNGDFDLAAWKVALDQWNPADLAPFVADGTLAGHMLLDDIVNFEGHDPTAAELEEMARYSRARLPGLMVYVREEAQRMPKPAGGRYQYVQFAVNQYTTRRGEVQAYTDDNMRASREMGLGVINGLNIADGGDGSSGQPGWGKGFWAMSPDEIRRYGSVLATQEGVSMFLCWEYDGAERWSDGSIGADYFRRPDVEAALRDLGRLVASRERPG
jgi:hypothetical protein